MAVVKKVIVLGGGSAGFMAAGALKLRTPGVDVLVIRSKDIGVIGVGEGSTIALSDFLYNYLHVGAAKFFEVARPTWKLGLKFLWGPRPYFHYAFGAQCDGRVEQLEKPFGYYCDGDMEDWDLLSALMTRDRIFARDPKTGDPAVHCDLSYHFENEKFVRFLEGYAAAVGARVEDDTVEAVLPDGRGGVGGLRLASGRTETADLYVDASGFRSELLGRALGEPFDSYDKSLFCDRAVVGGWQREADDPIRPYTTCETMDAGWCWQIEHEGRVNRGYVYSSAFIGDAEAEAEFRRKNPKVGPTRVVRFVSGRYRRGWVGNVVAVGNSSGFVEPLEATALGAISMQCRLIVGSLADGDGEILPSCAGQFNEHHARSWDGIRNFIAVHYKFNTRLETPFWRHCREHTDLAGAAPLVEYFRDVGPSAFWAPTLLDGFDPFKTGGYSTLLVGMKVPYRRRHVPGEAEGRFWEQWRRRNAEWAHRGVSIREALSAVATPGFDWAGALRRKAGYQYLDIKSA